MVSPPSLVLGVKTSTERTHVVVRIHYTPHVSRTDPNGSSLRWLASKKQTSNQFMEIYFRNHAKKGKMMLPLNGLT